LHSFTLAKAFGNLFVRFDPFLSWEAGIVKHRGIPVAVAEAECQASLQAKFEFITFPAIILGVAFV
jgi:hypothetical protein